MIELVGLTPAAEEDWWTLFDLVEANSTDWLLVQDYQRGTAALSFLLDQRTR